MSSRDIRMFMHDILQACAAIEQAVAGRTPESYSVDRQLRSSVEREFIIIGEALRRARVMDETIEDAIPQTPLIIGLRNNLVHQYEVIKDVIVWRTIFDDLPVLEAQAKLILDQYGGSI